MIYLATDVIDRRDFSLVMKFIWDHKTRYVCFAIVLVYFKFCIHFHFLIVPALAILYLEY